MSISKEKSDSFHWEIFLDTSQSFISEIYHWLWLFHRYLEILGWDKNAFSQLWRKLTLFHAFLPHKSANNFIMRLTAQMWMDFNAMQARIGAIHREAYSKFPTSFLLVGGLHREELKDFKIQLEILFSDTDDKEQSKIHLVCFN